jgi:hypothetical protein
MLSGVRCPAFAQRATVGRLAPSSAVRCLLPLAPVWRLASGGQHLPDNFTAQKTICTGDQQSHFASTIFKLKVINQMIFI